MEMQEPENFGGMTEMFNESLEPIVEKFAIITELANAYVSHDLITKMVVNLLLELDEIFISCALEHLEGEDMREVLEEWDNLDPIAKLDLIKNSQKNSKL
jgi:hypothetical protein